MECTVTWNGEETFTAQPPSGHDLDFDGNAEAGISPMETVISALGACSSIDVVMILEKGRHAITGCRCELTGERAETSPRVFTKIHAHFVVEGTDLKERAVERAVDLSFEKYCSVSMMLRSAVEITHSYEVVEAG